MEHIEVVVGRIGKPHGLRGEVTVEVRTDEPDRRFADGTTLRAEPPPGSASPPASLTVRRTRWHQGRLLVTFEELGDRDAAEGARGIMLHTEVDPDERPDDPDEFYDHQLVGLAAYDVAGTRLGEVTGLVHGGAQDLLTMRTATVVTRSSRSSRSSCPRSTSRLAGSWWRTGRASSPRSRTTAEGVPKRPVDHGAEERASRRATTCRRGSSSPCHGPADCLVDGWIQSDNDGDTGACPPL